MIRRKAIFWTVAGVSALSVVMGMRDRSRRAEGDVVKPVVSSERLPPAIVIAKRPTLSEIVDIILHERPTAAEIAGTSSLARGFPEGSDEAHVAGILSRRISDRTLVDRIAGALVREGRRRHVSSSLLVGVLLTENPELDPRATSTVGARGLMQVMPFHAGNWGCGSRDLFDVESNICHGVAVLADNLYRSRTLPQALLGYNGCVRGTNTPDCWKYPRTVYRRADFER
jgi:soluble lytic murein transglycosylase-like protein